MHTGHMWVQARASVVASDPLFYVAADGSLTNIITGGGLWLRGSTNPVDGQTIVQGSAVTFKPAVRPDCSPTLVPQQ
jgi:hypothetical protein